MTTLAVVMWRGGPHVAGAMPSFLASGGLLNSPGSPFGTLDFTPTLTVDYNGQYCSSVL